MQLDKEIHRSILQTAILNLPVQGNLGDPELFALVNGASEIITALEKADVAPVSHVLALQTAT